MGGVVVIVTIMESMWVANRRYVAWYTKIVSNFKVWSLVIYSAMSSKININSFQEIQKFHHHPPQIVLTSCTIPYAALHAQIVCLLSWNLLDCIFPITDSENINKHDEQICVSCPDGVCVVVLRPPQEVHSTMSHKIPSSEVRCFRQEQSGDYTVAVFRQNMNNTLHAFPLYVYMASISLTTCKSK